jgi:hypothetical protein
MKRRLIGVPAAALLFVLASCDSTTSPTSRPLDRAQIKEPGLQLAVSITRPGVGRMDFRIGIENGGQEEATLGFTDGQFFEIEVTDRGGNLVWRWSHDKGFTDALWSLKLGPDESYGQTADWDLTGNNGKPLSPGSYGCRVIITCSPRDEALVYETPLTI